LDWPPKRGQVTTDRAGHGGPGGPRGAPAWGSGRRPDEGSAQE